ncbi:Inosine/uridine-preferring nucleoside hydrolase domain-containing protein [Aspergillus candidus]|uniref:Inosine/uridine-preferring nucleoside hydrolase domain-containing protein n=1 Tax=Aspergillus candidus TaxID=41067 RepID=A0A2I2F5F8_ASPCN|nr:Inosine/uridine-preferring nucleoside hydrolase domain-containing protein [Aspergillus candidus]PLB35899.1 Inosine/uridine-preferring nucleoside hydrolase domain-containing protein [Aspergillus candidus]
MESNKTSLACLILVMISGVWSESSVPSDKRYAILDNDWLAVGFLPFLLVMKGGMEVLGLVSNTANTWQKQCGLHALANLELANLTCIPVYQGATWPLINTPERFQAWETVHGRLPFQGAFGPLNLTAERTGENPASGDPNRIVKEAFVEGFPNTSFNDATNAANFMVEMVHRHPHQVSVFSGGALTNIALAVRIDPSFASLVKELVIMGGYVDVDMFRALGDQGQANINSDINFKMDPEAAKIVLNADFPDITLVGNVANQIQATQEFLDEVYQVKNPLTRLFHDHYGTRFPFWDETAAGVMVDRSIALNTSTVYVDVDISYGSTSYGDVLVYNPELRPLGVRKVTYVNRVNGVKLKEMMKEAMWEPPTC